MRTDTGVALGRDGTTRLFLTAGVVGPVLFLLVVAVAGALRPGYSPVRDVISDLGAGPGGWIQNANFAGLGALLLAFAAGFHRAMRPALAGRWLTASAVLLAVSAVGLLAAATFPVPVPGAPTDQVMRQGLLHMASFLTIFTPLVVALFVVGWRLRREPGWRTLGAYSLATGGATLLLVLAMFVFASPDSPWQIGGLVSRLLVVVAFAWHALAGWRLLREEGAWVTLARALRRNSGRLLLTGAGVATVVGPLSADWNASHVFNERWPPRARFHGVVGLCTAVALTLYGLWHLWTNSSERALAAARATAVPVAYWGSFFPAVLVKGTGLDDPPPRVGRIAGVPANVFLATSTTAMAIAGCLLDRRAAPSHYRVRSP